VTLWQVLLDIVILLGVGALLGALLERLQQSAIVGYLLAGALLGPNVFHVVRSTDEVLAISELGVALLLFAIGLEFSWTRLRQMGSFAFGGGLVQVLATTAIGAGVAALAGLSAPAAFTIGAICALSSTACVLRELTSLAEVQSVHGERALGILLFQDIAVVPLVLIVSVLAAGGTADEIFIGVLRTAGIGLALVVALYGIFNFLVPRLLGSTAVLANRELPLLIAVVSGLGSGVAAHAAGVSPALGAFVAGMLLASSPFAVQVQADVSSLKTLLLTLFFAAMGMLTNPEWIASNALLVGTAVVLVVLGKCALVWVALRLFRARSQSALAAGICLGQIGEFSFVLAELARGRLFSEEVFMLIVSTTVITMILTPYLVSKAPTLASRFVRSSAPARDEAARGETTEQVLVIGFGPAGRAAAERIAELGCHVVVIDQNPMATRDAKKLGYSSVAGDALYPEVLEHAGLRSAISVVVTVPAATAALSIVRQVRVRAPEAMVLVRARFHRSLPELRAAGAHVIIDEEHEVGRMCAETFEQHFKARTTRPE